MSQTIRGVLLIGCVLFLGIMVSLLANWRASETEPGQSEQSFVQSESTLATSNGAAPDARWRTKTPRTRALLADDLVMQMVSVEIVDTPLRDVLNSLQAQHGIQIWIDEATLGDQAKVLDQDITLTANEVPFSTVLDRLLLPLKLDWLTDREVLRITTQAVADQHLEVRVYDVLDLVQAGFDEDTLVDIVEGCVEPETWASLKIGELLTSGGSGSKPEAAPADVTKKRLEKELPGTSPSRPLAKGRGRTRLHEGILIVWQTQRVHNQVEQLLNQIEVLLEEMDDDRRLEPQILAVKQRRSSASRGNQRKQLPRSIHQ